MKPKKQRRDPSVSFIITTYNSPQYLEMSLRSVFSQTVLPGEIIIADDGSDERTAELLRRIAAECPVPLVHVWHEDKGFRAGQIRNVAVAASRGEYLMMIDGDLVPERHYIADHLYFRKKGCVVEGNLILLSEERTARAMAEKKVKVNIFSRGIEKRVNTLRCRPAAWLLRPFVFRKKRDPFRLWGGLMSCWKEDYLRVNGYNHSFVGYGYEDGEFMIRMHFAGMRKTRIKHGACTTVHLHHPLRDRDSMAENLKHLNEVMSLGNKWCPDGLDSITGDIERYVKFRSDKS